MRPKIVTFSDEKIRPYAQFTEQINQAYADRHKYAFEASHDRKLGDDWDVQWEKVRILNEELRNPENSWVVWIDADAAVHHQDTPLESFMVPGKDIIVSHDGVNKKDDLAQEERDQPWYVNTGMLMVKNTPWSREFVKKWLDEAGEFKKGAKLQDQDKFVQMLRADWDGAALGIGAVKSHVEVLPPKAINSEYGDDTQDTFLWHLMAREEEYRKDQFEKLWLRTSAPVIEPPKDKSIKGNPKKDTESVAEAYHSRYRTHPKQKAPVLIVMLYDDPIASYSVVSENVNRIYASRHGYDLMAVQHRLSDRDPQWDKVRAIDILLNEMASETEGHEWFFWIDSDAVFAQHDVALRQILDGAGKDFVISDDSPNKGRKAASADEVYVNTGTFGVKRGEWAKAFMKKWWETPMGMENKRFHEQDVIGHLYKTNEMGLRQKMAVLPYDAINSAFSELPRHFSSVFPISEGRAGKKFVLHMMQSPADLRRRAFDVVERMVSRQPASRPLHVVDPPAKYHKIKPLNPKGTVSEFVGANKFALIAACIGVLLLVIAIVFMGRKSRRRTRAGPAQAASFDDVA